MGLITAGMGAVLKHIKKPGKAFEKAGDKWFKKTKKLQTSKKKSERIRGNLRIVAPMAGAGTAGAYLGAKDAQEAIRKRGVYGVGRKDVGPKSLIQDIKAAGKKIKKKFTKK
jgi:hypothetical protein